MLTLNPDDPIALFNALDQIHEQNALELWFTQCYGSPASLITWKDHPGGPPTWQREFYDAGKTSKQRMIMAANGVGKSQSVCAEVAAHATGEYPPWWDGCRFDKGGFEIWVGSIDNDMQKRGPQRAMMGRDLGSQLGTGLLPKHAILDFDLRQAGVKEVVDTVVVKHRSGQNVIIKWLTFEQGWRKWQSGDPRIIMWDEEPDESNVEQKDILDETLTRLVRNNGIFLVGYTPLLGETQLTEHFMHSEDSAVWWVGATWDDAPHMDPEQRRLIEDQYSDHQKEARTKGIPMLGEGRIFAVPEHDFVINPIPIPDHWARIKGIDFGIDHPAAMASLAIDRDTDTVYLYKDWKKSGCLTRDHADVINATDPWIPVAWPHDGARRDANSGKRLYELYRDKHHCTMLSKSARYKTPEDKGGGQPQWPIIEDLRIRLAEGRFKVFRSCQEFLKEYRSYHMKDGKIVAKRDDLLKAGFYALMMVRYARSKTASGRSGRSTMPMPQRTSA